MDNTCVCVCLCLCTNNQPIMESSGKSSLGEPRKKRVYTPLSGCALSMKNAYLDDKNIPQPTIHNIVSTSKIMCVSSRDTQHEGEGVHIDLDHIHEVVQCSNYNRKKFAAITIRIDDPTVTALLFTSGRLVITGSKSWYECMLASLVIVKMLREVQPECHFYVQVCNKFLLNLPKSTGLIHYALHRLFELFEIQVDVVLHVVPDVHLGVLLAGLDHELLLCEKRIID